MRIVLDRDKCEGLGMCEAMAHHVFELEDEDGPVTVHDDSPPESERDVVHAAVQACPVLALTLEG